MNLSSIITDVQQNWMLYCALPIVAAMIGYVTKLVAIRMMFEPLEFVGIKPYFGWQGIVPRKAEFMANIAVDTVTTHLINAQDLFDRLDPKRVAQALEAPLTATVDDIVRDVAASYQPGLWESLPEMVRKKLIQRVQKEAPNQIAEIMHDVKDNLDEVFDLRDMVVSNLTRDIPLLNRMFKQVGRKEFRFIARSGIYFGFAIGCLQAVAWALTHEPWIMPLFGGFVGWFSDWMALKMIFEPKEERRYFLFLKWQGLFIKRRHEVAAEYGALIAREILTPHNMVEALLKGPSADRLFDMVQKHIQKLVDEQAGLIKPLVVYSVGSRNYQKMKSEVAEKFMARAPDTLRHVEQYAEDAMNLEQTLVEKMQQMTMEQFEGLLRPVFQQDEKTLIAVGAVLGFLVGELQVQIMLH